MSYEQQQLHFVSISCFFKVVGSLIGDQLVLSTLSEELYLTYIVNCHVFYLDDNILPTGLSLKATLSLDI